VRFHSVIPRICSVIYIVFNMQSNPCYASASRYMDVTFHLKNQGTIRKMSITNQNWKIIWSRGVPRRLQEKKATSKPHACADVLTEGTAARWRSDIQAVPEKTSLLEKWLIVTPGIHYWYHLVTVADTNNDGLTS
jgi:hypothetical protein